MSRTIRNEAFTSYYNREVTAARKAEGRSRRGKVAAQLRAMATNPELADFVPVLAFRGTEGHLSH
jgi:hypothetical protein